MLFKYNFFVVLLFLFSKTYSQDIKSVNKLNNEFSETIFLNFLKAEEIAKQSLEFSKYLENDSLVLLAYNNLSKVYVLKSNFSKSLDYTNLGLDLAIKLKNRYVEAELNNRLCKLKYKNSEFLNALKINKKVEQVASDLGLNELLCKSYISKSNLYIVKQEHNNARKYADKALLFAKKNKDSLSLIFSYIALAEIKFLKDKDSALYFCNKALKYAKPLKNNYAKSTIYNQIVFLKAYYEDKDILKYADLAEEISSQIGDSTSLGTINFSLGLFYEQLEQYNKAIQYYKKSLNISKGQINKINVLNNYLMLSSALWHNNDYKDAYYYLEQYTDLNDSIFSVKKAKEFNELKTQYEVEKKDNQIVLLKTKNELESTRKKWIIAAASLLLIAISLLTFFYRHRVMSLRIITKQEKALRLQERLSMEKEKQLKASEALIKGQDEERHRIAKELHDGVGGQLANVTLGLTNLNVNLENPDIDKINNQLLNVFKDLRGVSHRLNSNYLQDKTFKELLASLQDAYTNTAFTFDISVFPEDCLKEIEVEKKHHLYRILQELLTNISKHAKASEVLLNITAHKDMLSVIVEDNGNGFDVKASTKGVGLKNIMERVVSINGTLVLDSKIGKGTSVIIEISNIENS